MKTTVTLRKKKDFKNVFDQGRVFVSKTFVAHITENSFHHNRFGFVVSKKTGHAVRRNRAKRLMREVVRQNGMNMKKGYDIVLIARSALIGKKYIDVEKDFIHMIRKFGMIYECTEDECHE